MNAMISQPMNRLSDEKILETRKVATKVLNKFGYEIVDSYFNDDSYSDELLKQKGVENISVYFLAKSIEQMSFCEAVYFCKGWENARGCRIEHEIAKNYGLKLIYEN